MATMVPGFFLFYYYSYYHRYHFSLGEAQPIASDPSYIEAGWEKKTKGLG